MVYSFNILYAPNATNANTIIPTIRSGKFEEVKQTNMQQQLLLCLQLHHLKCILYLL